MAWLEIEWDLNRFREEDSGGDETGLHFAIVTVIDGQAHVHAHTTGDLSDVDSAPSEFGVGDIETPGFWGRIRSQVNVPSPDNPYVGLVVRAIDYDGSSAEQRQRDYENFHETIQVIAQDCVDNGGVPGAQTLWMAGYFHALDDDGIDPDDRLGVSARADRDYGLSLAPRWEGEADLEIGTPLVNPRTQRLVFSEHGAEYRFAFDWKVRAGEAGTIPAYVSGSYRGSSPTLGA